MGSIRKDELHQACAVLRVKRILVKEGIYDSFLLVNKVFANIYIERDAGSSSTVKSSGPSRFTGLWYYIFSEHVLYFFHSPYCSTALSI